jgi:hypothetical protein
VTLLRPYAGSIVDLVRLDDFEAAVFADDIAKVLTDAGWRLSVSRIGSTTPRYGVQCTMAADSPAVNALAKVLDALPTSKLVTDLSLFGLAGRIFVGLKPPS